MRKTEHKPKIAEAPVYAKRGGSVLGLVSLAFGIVLVAALSQVKPSQIPRPVAASQPGLYQVVHVTDGDTFEVRDSLGHTDTVRMLGMDTPETKDPRKAVQCFGQAASAVTHSLLDGRKVRLVADPTDSDRDKYHRLLRYVYLPDGTFVNLKLVTDGYAFAYVVFPIEKLEEFKAAEAEARTANRGLWGGCRVDETSKIKQTNPV
jgi:endonuclease YncB( thermonuclease family)